MADLKKLMEVEPFEYQKMAPSILLTVKQHWPSQHAIEYDEDEDVTMEMEQIGAERTKNVPILMSDTGGSHRASAEAIRDAFQQYRVWVKSLKEVKFKGQKLVALSVSLI